jgi:hypothetical protein
MVEREHPERRRGGLHSVTLTDGNGGVEQRWVINVKAWSGRIGLLAAALALLGTGLGLGQALVRHEIDSYCIEQLQPPDGKLHQAMSDCADRTASKLERGVDARFDKVETRLATIEAEIETAKRDRARQHAEIINLLRNQ